MNARPFLFAIVGIWTLTAGCAAASDIVAQPAARPAAAIAAEAPADWQRDHVHVFLVNGLDPFFFCQFNKMPDYARSLGYEHVHFGQMTQSPNSSMRFGGFARPTLARASYSSASAPAPIQCAR